MRTIKGNCVPLDACRWFHLNSGKDWKQCPCCLDKIDLGYRCMSLAHTYDAAKS